MYEQNDQTRPSYAPLRVARPLPEAFDELLERLSQAAEERRVLRDGRKD